MEKAGYISFLDEMGDLLVLVQLVDAAVFCSHPQMAVPVEVQAGDGDVFARQVIEKVEVSRLFIIDVYFIPFSDKKSFVEINTGDVSLQKRFELLGREVEFCHALRAQHEYFPVLIARNAKYRVAEQAVRIVFLKFESLDVIAVVAVEPLTRSYPYHPLLVYIQTVDGKLRQPVVSGQMVEGDVLLLGKNDGKIKDN